MNGNKGQEQSMQKRENGNDMVLRKPEGVLQQSDWQQGPQRISWGTASNDAETTNPPTEPETGREWGKYRATGGRGRARRTKSSSRREK